MRTYQTPVAVLCGMLILLLFPINGHSITTMSIQFEDALRLISLDMPRREVIETLGTPDFIKSEGMCLQYEYLGLSVFINKKRPGRTGLSLQEFQGIHRHQTALHRYSAFGY